MKRVLKSEWLDELPASDGRAIRSRRDLRRINLWMGNAVIVTRALQAMAVPSRPVQVADLGAGDGTFLLSVAKRLAPRWPKTEAVLVDRQEVVAPETRAALRQLGWRVRIVEADACDWLKDGTVEIADVILANLFLHHFNEEELRSLLQFAAGKTGRFIACEPRRFRWGACCARLLGVIGCNDVTRHDAGISIRAGFTENELSRLWPTNGDWEMQEHRGGRFSHLFHAWRVR